MRVLRTRTSPGAGAGIGSSRNSMVRTAVTTMRRLLNIEIHLSRWVVPATSSDDSARSTGKEDLARVACLRSEAKYSAPGITPSQHYFPRAGLSGLEPLTAALAARPGAI